MQSYQTNGAGLQFVFKKGLPIILSDIASLGGSFGNPETRDFTVRMVRVATSTPF